MRAFLYLILISSITLPLHAHAKICQETRLGFDIGSGSTKMLVAKVDFCEHKIVEVLHSESRSIAFNEDLEKNKDNKLSPAIIEVGLKNLQEMTAKGRSFKPKKIYGVATSVFRKSHNGVDVIKGYAKKLGIKLEVIAQTDEAMLGYLSARSATNEKNIVVWDIGGGSMQMWSQVDDKKPLVYLGDLASVTFKNMVIEVIQLKDTQSVSSPNPIGDKRDQIILLAKSYAKLHVNAELKKAISELSVYGVGGVHSQSIKNQLQLKEMKYTLEEITRGSATQVLKSDSELTGNYRATDVTNLLLVQGFMEGLGIKEVKLVDATLLQGVVLR